MFFERLHERASLIGSWNLVTSRETLNFQGCFIQQTHPQNENRTKVFVLRAASNVMLKMLKRNPELVKLKKTQFILFLCTFTDTLILRC